MCTMTTGNILKCQHVQLAQPLNGVDHSRCVEAHVLCGAQQGELLASAALARAKARQHVQDLLAHSCQAGQTVVALHSLQLLQHQDSPVHYNTALDQERTAQNRRDCILVEGSGLGCLASGSQGCPAASCTKGSMPKRNRPHLTGIWPGRGRQQVSCRACASEGFTCAGWQQTGLTWMRSESVLSPRSAPQLRSSLTMVRRPLRSASPSGVLPHRSSTLTSASYLQTGHHEKVAKQWPALAVTLSSISKSRKIIVPSSRCLESLQTPFPTSQRNTTMIS